ncbi:MAG: hypothetical protein HKN87_02350 [Saprospiraceae bacterium]|nr:hypothetical protein [Saprospiraceae bacterium]
MNRPKKLFLIDALGAFVSALCLGYLLVRFEHLFGMPKNVLYVLASIAIGFSINSIASWAFAKESWRRALRIIAIANLLYCCITVVLVLYYWQYLTALGLAYFMIEIILVVLLSYAEFRNSLVFRVHLDKK